MVDDSSMFLKLILEEQKETRNDIKQIRSEQATREEFASYRDEMKELFDNLRNRQKATEEIVDKVVNDSNLNTSFRNGLINGIKYIAGATFVAVLGIIGAIVPNFFYSHNDKNSILTSTTTSSGSNSVSSPSSSSIPFKPLRLKVQNIK